MALPYLKYPSLNVAIGCYVTGAVPHIKHACQAFYNLWPMYVVTASYYSCGLLYGTKGKHYAYYLAIELMRKL